MHEHSLKQLLYLKNSIKVLHFIQQRFIISFMSKKALLRAVQILGSQAKLARAIGVKQPYIYNWINRDKKLPAEWVLKIEAAAKGLITRHELRPDLYPRE